MKFPFVQNFTGFEELVPRELCRLVESGLVRLFQLTQFCLYSEASSLPNNSREAPKILHIVGTELQAKSTRAENADRMVICIEKDYASSTSSGCFLMSHCCFVDVGSVDSTVETFISWSLLLFRTRSARGIIMLGYQSYEQSPSNGEKLLLVWTS